MPKYYSQPKGTRSPWRKGDSKAGAGNISDEPGISCDRKYGSSQRMMETGA